MTAGEIIDLYTHAKHPEKQIGIIAELCDCPKKEIVELLKLNGVLEQNKGGKELRPDSVVFQDNHKKWRYQYWIDYMHFWMNWIKKFSRKHRNIKRFR